MRDGEPRNRPGVLCCLPLGVVEVRGGVDNIILNLGAKVRLGNLLHLNERRRRDFLRVESLLFTHAP